MRLLALLLVPLVAGARYDSGSTHVFTLESGHWLKPNDVVEVEFDRIGMLRNRVVKKTA